MVSEVGTSGRVARKRQIRQANILKIAAKLFSEKGYGGTSLDEVADQLDLTKGTLYHYFGSKEELLATCVDAGALDAIKRLQSVDASFGSNDCSACLRELILTQLEIIVIDAPELSRLFTERRDWPPLFRKRIKQYREEHDRIFRERIHRGVSSGELHCEDEEIALHCLHGAINYAPAWLNVRSKNRSAQMACIADTLMKMFVAT